MFKLHLTVPRKHLYVILALVALRWITVPWIHVPLGEWILFIGREDPLLSAYYLAGYNIDIIYTQLWTRGEIFIPFLWSLIIRIFDLLQLPVRLSMYVSLYSLPILCSTAIIFAYLLGSELFDKKLGLNYAVLLGLCYIFWYFSNIARYTAPCATLMLVSAYFFWKTLQKDSQLHWFVLCALFTVFAFETEYFAAALLIFYLAYLILTKNFGFFKRRNLWIGVLVGVLAIAPWFYLNYSFTGSTVGFIIGTITTGHLYKAEPSSGPFAYARLLAFLLPFPNFILFFYGVYVSLRNVFRKEQTKENVFALLFWVVVFCSMSALGVAMDWYYPIVMPGLVLFSSIGVVGVYTELRKIRALRIYAQKFYLALLLFSALAINQIHPLLFLYLEDSSIHFYSLKRFLLGFAIPKIVNWSNLWAWEPAIVYLESVGKSQVLGPFLTAVSFAILAALYVLGYRKARRD